MGGRSECSRPAQRRCWTTWRGFASKRSQPGRSKAPNRWRRAASLVSPVEQGARYSGHCGRQPEGVTARCGSGERQRGGRHRQESPECLSAAEPPGSRPRVACRGVMGAMASPVPGHRSYTGLPVPKTRSFRPWDQSAQFRAHSIDLSALTGRAQPNVGYEPGDRCYAMRTRAASKCSSHSELHRPHATATALAVSAETFSDRAATSYGSEGWGFESLRARHRLPRSQA